MSYYVTHENSVLNINNAHLKVSGNVQTDVLKLGAMEFAPPASDVPGTVNFTNVTTGVTTTSNLNVGGTLMLGSVELAMATNALEQTVNLGNTTSNTVQFTNATTGIVATGNVEVGGELTVTGNATVSSNLTVSGNVEVGTAKLFVDTVNSRVGIGTTSASTDLQIGNTSTKTSDTYLTLASDGGSAYAQGIRLIHNGTDDSNMYGWRIRGDDSDDRFHINYIHQGSHQTSALTIKSGGDVGIGTTSPGGPLHLFKSAPNNGDTGPGILFTRYSDTYGGCIWSESNNNLDGLYFNVFSNSPVSTHYGGTPAMVINSNGRVGVGTNNPATKLHLYDTTNEPTIALQHLSGGENNSSTNVLGNLALHYSPRSGHGASVGIRSIRRANTWDDQADMEFYVRNGNHGEQTAMVINSASTSGGAKVGINTTNPLGKLDIRQGGNVSMGGTTQQLSDPAPGLTLTSSSVKWAIFINTNRDLIFTSHHSLSGNYVGVTGYILEGAYDQRMNDFTGQHRCFLAGVKASEIVNKTGLIVCANKNQYTMISNKTLTGQEAIDISESIPNVSISHKAYDKTCFGVISDVEDPEKREDVYGVWGCPFPKENGDDRVYINSVGEGAIWVTNINGPLESGDYITTSNVAGYGQKQDSEFLANYTVAKITMDCDFEPATQPVQVIKKDEEGENILDEYGQIQWENDPSGATEKAYKIRYLDADGNITDEASAVHKAAFVGCTYHCG